MRKRRERKGNTEKVNETGEKKNREQEKCKKLRPDGMIFKKEE